MRFRGNPLYEYPNWFVSYKEDHPDVHFPEAGTWRLGQQLSEKAWPPERPGEVVESVAVFHCTRIDSTDFSDEAILKIRMQVPHLSHHVTDKPSESSLERRKEASQPTTETRQEALILKRLTLEKCSATPKYIASFEATQDDDMWVPGGYILYILMEKVPGDTVFNLWDGMDEAERTILRAHFKDALYEVARHGFDPADARSQNIMWDREEQRCRIVDLESFEEEERDLIELFENKINIFARWDLLSPDPDAYRLEP